MATGMCWPKYQILHVFKIKVVFTSSRYNVSASCIIIYDQTVCPFQYIQIFGITIDDQLRFDQHILYLYSKSTMQLNALGRLQKYMGKPEKSCNSK